MTLPFADQFVRLLLALVLGAVIGIERERRDYAAGFRTHALVSVGSALFIIVSTYGFSDVVGSRGVALDPSRVAAQVVTGVGFLGGGAILVQRGTVHGLTTAAGIWLVAAIGLACGAGLFSVALIGAVMALLVLVPFKVLERRVFQHARVIIDVRVVRAGRLIGAIHSELDSLGVTLRTLRISNDGKKGERLLLELEAPRAQAIRLLVQHLGALEGVDRITARNL